MSNKLLPYHVNLDCIRFVSIRTLPGTRLSSSQHTLKSLRSENHTPHYYCHATPNFTLKNDLPASVPKIFSQY